MKITSITQKLILICGIIGISLSYVVAKDGNTSSIQQEVKSLSSVSSVDKSSLNERCSKPLSEEMDTTTVCKYSSKSIEQVYQNMLKKHVGEGTASALKSKLPSKNTQYDVKDNSDGVIFISYKYKSKSKKDLLIEVQFEGGSDSYAIKQQKNELQLTILNSPD